MSEPWSVTRALCWPPSPLERFECGEKERGRPVTRHLDLRRNRAWPQLESFGGHLFEKIIADGVDVLLDRDTGRREIVVRDELVVCVFSMARMHLHHAPGNAKSASTKDVSVGFSDPRYSRFSYNLHCLSSLIYEILSYLVKKTSLCLGLAVSKNLNPQGNLQIKKVSVYLNKFFKV